MSVFELIKLVLDQEYSGIPGNKDEAINAELKALSAAYSRLTDTKSRALNYSDAARRFAYIYKYTTCHADLVAQKIRAVKALRDLFDQDGWVDVACVGGGPGSDFLGIIKHMIGYDSSTALKAYLLDREAGWGDSWADVERQAEGLDFRVSTHSQVLDVVEPDTWNSQVRHRQADLFTFIYFISEVWRVAKQAQPYFEDLFASAKPGSYFLFIDNNDATFYDYFDGMAEAAGFDRVAGGEESFLINYDEQKTDLEPYFSRFDHQPKLKTSIAWRVYRKP